MNKSKVALATSAGLIAAAFVATFIFQHSSSTPVDNPEVYTWDCEIPVQQPDAITLTCGDGGMYVDHITWSTWGEDGATGTGSYHVNTCDPNCAEGEFLTSQVEIRLSKLTKYNGLNYLRALTMKTLNGENLPESGQSTYEWDVMDFAEMMAE